jgi:hypothetical protein
MNDDERRLARLRGLVVRLERLPESAQREWMLGEVRARMVDIDTGFPAQPLRRPRESEPAPATTRAAKRPAAKRSKPALDARVEPLEAPRHEAPPAARETPVPIDPDHVLWLDDSTDASGTPAASDLPRWRRGLRG